MKIPRLTERDEEGRASYGGWLDLALQSSLTLAISVAALAWLGKWLDGVFGTYPLLLVIGALWGAGGGTAWTVIRIKQYADARDKEEGERKTRGED